MSNKKITKELKHEAKMHRISGAMCLSDLFMNAAITIQKQADRIERLEYYTLGLANESVKLQDRIAELELSMQHFVDRCNLGETRSSKTYARFKQLLNKAGDL